MADPGMIAGIIQGGVGSLLDTIGLGYGIYQDQRNNQQSQAQFDKSYQFAVESRDLQQQNLQTLMNREDNAVQRRVADLEAAGIHKQLAVGGMGAAGSGPYGNVAGNVNQGSVGSQSVPMMSARMDLLRTLDNHDISMAEVARLQAETARIKASIPRDDKYLGLNTSYFQLAEKRDLREGETHVREGETHALNLQLLQSNLEMQPERFKSLILDNAQKSINIDSSKLELLQQVQDLRISELKYREQQLTNMAAELGITRDRLENTILAHDAEIILSIDSLRHTEQFETDQYVRSIIPEGSNNYQLRRSMLAGVLNTGNAFIGSLLKRGRK